MQPLCYTKLYKKQKRKEKKRKNQKQNRSLYKFFVVAKNSLCSFQL